MHCWISLAEDEVLKMVSEGELEEGQGHRYVDANGQQLVEFHVDDHESFIKRGAELHAFGGNLSVRKPDGAKPVILLGQDEAIFKQFTSNYKAWTMPDGSKAIMPKDDGAGVMVSAFVSREFGFGVEWSTELMEKANQLRAGQKYVDKDAAEEVVGSADKPPLTSSLLVKEFEYGASKEGYWNYNHMVIQVEDCVDVLRAMLGHDYDIVFMVDHSCGHDRHRPDGLSVTKLLISYGGSQPLMRMTKLDDQACFGPFPRTMAEFEAAQKAAELVRIDNGQAKHKRRRKMSTGVRAPQSDEGLDPP